MSVNLMSSIFEVEFFDIKDAEGNVTKASTAKLVLLAMADHANDEGEGAYPSIERLCKKTALSEQTIRNTFDALRHNGIIELSGKSKYGTNNHTINTKSFPRAIGKEVTVLTLYPLDPLTGCEKGSNGSPELVLPVIPESLLTTKETSTSKAEILATASLEWTLASDEQVTQEQVDTANLKDTAPKMFEKALGFSKPLPWWNSKDWTDFAEWVCAEYSRSKTSFGEYNVWRNTPYVKGGIANTRLRGFPNEFYDSWDMFRMANPDKPKVQHKVYRPEEHEEPKYVPAPPRKR